MEDVNGGIIPGAVVTIDDPNVPGSHSVVANDDGAFTLADVPSTVTLHIRVHAEGFKDWVSLAITLSPGQMYEVADIKLSLAEVETSVTVIPSDVLAIQQVHAEEKQRLLGVIPNFYIAYGQNTQPLSAKLKFHLAFKTITDAGTIGGAAFLAGLYQAADTPNYQEGVKGYGQRFGAVYTNGATDILIGGAILPSLLHQDPRYFYQGTGSKKSRALHAISAPFVAKGDNGRWQFNYSSIGGDLSSGALQNLYYPSSNRGASLVFTGAAITTAARVANALAQEFLFNKVTSKSNAP
ncbi:hypothetical protein GCM10011586_14810 [Silvibacterium dinghuense]|nr:hypothetical protein GCM10011586_14810 [Silvibacterium dinghuense]